MLQMLLLSNFANFGLVLAMEKIYCTKGEYATSQIRTPAFYSQSYNVCMYVCVIYIHTAYK